LASADKPTSGPLDASTDFRKVEALGAHRAERENSMQSQSPRDILIETLGMIDRGELDPDTLVIAWGCWAEEHEHTRTSGFRVAALDSLAVNGLLARIQYRFNAP